MTGSFGAVTGRVGLDELGAATGSSDLVKLLALTSRRRLHREQVIDALWPDLDA